MILVLVILLVMNFSLESFRGYEDRKCLHRWINNVLWNGRILLNCNWFNSRTVISMPKQTNKMKKVTRKLFHIFSNHSPVYNYKHILTILSFLFFYLYVLKPRVLLITFLIRYTNVLYEYMKSYILPYLKIGFHWRPFLGRVWGFTTSDLFCPYADFLSIFLWGKTPAEGCANDVTVCVRLWYLRRHNGRYSLSAEDHFNTRQLYSVS